MIDTDFSRHQEKQAKAPILLEQSAPGFRLKAQ